MMARINELLSTDNPRLMFVTLMIGVLDIHTGNIRYANGGHNPPIVIPAAEKAFFKTDLSGPFLGTRAGLEYRELTLRLHPGESLFLYTDGVTESMNPAQEVFSDERLLAEIERRRGRSLKKIIRKIIRRIKQHAETEPQSDDIAMMMIRYNGPGQ
jgi:sigma-B regulation protein RsbU (phosphoserine phosphatase)